MTRRLEGSVCVVSGASSGIGAAIADAFLTEGAGVVGLARRFAASPARRPSGGQRVDVRCDVTDEAQVRGRFSEIGAVDVLVNCAGIGIYAPIALADVQDLRAMLDVHIVGSFLCTREALRSMQEQRSGHIVNIGSTAHREAFATCSAYAAAKAGQIAMGRVVAEECRSYGIRVTGVEIGAVDTPIWDGRSGFDRAQMMKAKDVAAAIVDVIACPGVAIEELVIVPPGGHL